jgi:hypothetical protein
MRRLVVVLALAMGTVLAVQAPGVAGADTLGRDDAGLNDTVAGSFAALIESPFVVRDLPGGRCEVTVGGRLRFEGTLQGDAVGSTTARILSPCEELDLTDPDFRDAFRFDGTFTGTVAGQAVMAPLTYAGVTSPGGTINARIHLGTTPPLVLQTQEAKVGVGGKYTSAPPDRPTHS